MSDDVSETRAEPSAGTVGGDGASELPAHGSRPKSRKRRAPTPAELALLRWLLAKPRPVTVGPIGNCVKRGWCVPVRSVIEDHDGRKLAFVYVVTEAGSLLLSEHGPERAGATRADPPTIDAPSTTTASRVGGIGSEKEARAKSPSSCPGRSSSRP